MRDFRDLPWPAKVYTAAVTLLAGLILARSGLGLTFHSDQFFFLLLGFIAAQIPYRFPGMGERFYLTLGSDLAAFLAAGPGVAVVNAGLGRFAATLVSEGRAGHIPWHRAIVNSAHGVLTIAATIPLYHRLAGWTVSRPEFSWLPYIGAMLMIGFATTALSALDSAVMQRVSFIPLMLRDLAVTSSNALMVVIAGTILGGFFRSYPVTWTGILVALAFAGLVVYASRLYTGISEMYWATVHAVVAAIELRDPCRAGHSERVARYAVALGRKLYLPDWRLAGLYFAGLVHDIGWIGVDEELLTAPTPPKHRETLLTEHIEDGVAVVSEIEISRGLANFVRYHHQWFNGNGYPGGRHGQQIPLEARILAIVNAYDSMTTSRSYREGLTPEEAIQCLKRGAHTQFDPNLVRVFLEVIAEEKRWGTPVFIRSHWLNSVGAAPRW